MSHPTDPSLDAGAAAPSAGVSSRLDRWAEWYITAFLDGLQTLAGWSLKATLVLVVLCLVPIALVGVVLPRQVE